MIAFVISTREETMTRIDVQAEGATPIDVSAFHASRRFARTHFGRIAYIERGAGPVALFMHGFPLNGYQWRGALERLSSRRRCIAPDFMGLGYTEVTADQDLAPATQAEMIGAFLSTLSIDAVDVIAKRQRRSHCAAVHRPKSEAGPNPAPHQLRRARE